MQSPTQTEIIRQRIRQTNHIKECEQLLAANCCQLLFNLPVVGRKNTTSTKFPSLLLSLLPLHGHNNLPPPQPTRLRLCAFPQTARGDRGATGPQQMGLSLLSPIHFSHFLPPTSIYYILIHLLPPIHLHVLPFRFSEKFTCMCSHTNSGFPGTGLRVTSNSLS